MSQVAKSRIDTTAQISLPKRIDSTFFMTPTNAVEIKKIVPRFKIKYTVGSDGLSMNTVKKCINSLCVPLAALVNKCCDIGYFPDDLKLAKVVAIPKAGSKMSTSNYRPISIF